MAVEGEVRVNKKDPSRRAVFKGGVWVEVSGGATPSSARAAAPRKLATREMMELDEARQAARSADEAARTAEQFVEINRGQNTGGLWGLPMVGKVAGAFDPEINQLNALTARMAPQQRVPGSGTTSDRDLSLYLQAVPGLEKPGPANSAIARQARKDADRRAAYAQFLDVYASQNGTLIGAAEAWDKSQRSRGKPASPKPVAQGDGWKVLSVE